MEITIRQYEERDRANVIACMEGLQDHIAALDPLKRIARLPGYGEIYIDWVIKFLEEHKGVMYVAEDSSTLVGFIAGAFGTHESYENVARTSLKPYGRIQELYINPDYRSQGVGAQLLAKLEVFFKTHDCDVMMVEAAAYNERAHNFYHQHGYENRAIDLLKQL